jgi:succinate dehydrogenase/fumarate reductase flavoprotein subunit
MQSVGDIGATGVPCYSLGGLRIDDHCRTSVPGLYAAGEAAGGVHGARLLPGNELTEATVFGAHAGRYAALERRPIPRIKEEGVKEEIMRLKRLARRMARGKQGGTSTVDFAGQLNSVMQEGAGPTRSASALETAAGWLEAHAQNWLDNIEAPEAGVSGPGLWDVLEVDALLELAQMVVKAATMREESRGAHQRTDFPEADPAWAVNIIARTDGDEHVFTSVPVETASVPLEVAGL